MSPTKCGNFASSWGLMVIIGLPMRFLRTCPRLASPGFLRKIMGQEVCHTILLALSVQASACDWHGLTSTSRGVVEACPGWYWSELTCWNCLDYASNMLVQSLESTKIESCNTSLPPSYWPDLVPLLLCWSSWNTGTETKSLGFWSTDHFKVRNSSRNRSHMWSLPWILGIE